MWKPGEAAPPKDQVSHLGASARPGDIPHCCPVAGQHGGRHSDLPSRETCVLGAPGSAPASEQGTLPQGSPQPLSRVGSEASHFWPKWVHSAAELHLGCHVLRAARSPARTLPISPASPPPLPPHGHFHRSPPSLSASDSPQPAAGPELRRWPPVTVATTVWVEL